MPAGVVNVIRRSSSGQVVSAILHDPRVRKISFTGSTKVGRVLLREAAKTIVKLAMELGGNAPFIVFDDADLDEAVDGAMIAKMRNGGEACTAANRFYVQKRCRCVHRKITAKMATLNMGTGLDAGVALGPLVNKDGRDKVDELVDDAAQKGAKVLTGGMAPDRKGFFYPPTVLADVPDDANMLNDEIFGPIASLQPSPPRTKSSAANETEYGLVAYLYTGSGAGALRSRRRSNPA